MLRTKFFELHNIYEPYFLNDEAQMFLSAPALKKKKKKKLLRFSLSIRFYFFKLVVITSERSVPTLFSIRDRIRQHFDCKCAISHRLVENLRKEFAHPVTQILRKECTMPIGKIS